MEMLSGELRSEEMNPGGEKKCDDERNAYWDTASVPTCKKEYSDMNPGWMAFFGRSFYVMFLLFLFTVKMISTVCKIFPSSG